jgi:hypothetical protein
MNDFFEGSLTFYPHLSSKPFFPLNSWEKGLKPPIIFYLLVSHTINRFSLDPHNLKNSLRLNLCSDALNISAKPFTVFYGKKFKTVCTESGDFIIEDLLGSCIGYKRV